MEPKQALLVALKKAIANVACLKEQLKKEKETNAKTLKETEARCKRSIQEAELNVAQADSKMADAARQMVDASQEMKLLFGRQMALLSLGHEIHVDLIKQRPITVPAPGHVRVNKLDLRQNADSTIEESESRPPKWLEVNKLLQDLPEDRVKEAAKDRLASSPRSKSRTTTPRSSMTPRGAEHPRASSLVCDIPDTSDDVDIVDFDFRESKRQVFAPEDSKPFEEIRELRSKVRAAQVGVERQDQLWKLSGEIYSMRVLQVERLECLQARKELESTVENREKEVNALEMQVRQAVEDGNKFTAMRQLRYTMARMGWEAIGISLFKWRENVTQARRRSLEIANETVVTQNKATSTPARPPDINRGGQPWNDPDSDSSPGSPLQIQVQELKKRLDAEHEARIAFEARLLEDRHKDVHVRLPMLSLSVPTTSTTSELPSPTTPRWSLCPSEVLRSVAVTPRQHPKQSWPAEVMTQSPEGQFDLAMRLMNSFGSPEWEQQAARFEASLASDQEADHRRQSMLETLIETMGTPGFGSSADDIEASLDLPAGSYR